MAKRMRLCPEITDPGLRSFLDMLPSIRRFNDDLVKSQPIRGQRILVPLQGREIEVYWHKTSAKENRPVVFEFHGGGFMMGNAEKCDSLCRKMSRTLDCHVIGINYRFAPENPYPAAVDDAYDVIKYFHDYADQYGIDVNKMAVMGYSAGATLATVTAMQAVKRKEFKLCAQVLHYPYLDAMHLPDEKEHFDCDMDPEVMKAFTLLYSKEEERYLSYVSPINASIEELKGVAPACILPAMKDSLCNEGKLYANKLRQAGVDTYLQVVPDVHHGYIEDSANEYVYSMGAEDVRSTHSRYFREWAKASMGITYNFLLDQFEGKNNE